MPDAFQARYVHWQKLKTRPYVELYFEIPVEYADVAYQVLGGMPGPAEEVWVGIARLVPKAGRVDGVLANPLESQPTTAETDSAHERPAPDRSPARVLAQTVGRFCADIRFRRWAMDLGKVSDVSEIAVAEWVRQFCDVSSRKDIKSGTEAEQRWNLIQSAYESETRV